MASSRKSIYMMLTKEQKSVKNGLKQKKHSADQELSIPIISKLWTVHFLQLII